MQLCSLDFGVRREASEEKKGPKLYSSLGFRPKALLIAGLSGFWGGSQFEHVGFATPQP